MLMDIKIHILMTVFSSLLLPFLYVAISVHLITKDNDILLPTVIKIEADEMSSSPTNNVGEIGNIIGPIHVKQAVVDWLRRVCSTSARE